MSQIMKHVGKYGEKPCLVIFRELPDEPENCLIVQTSNLNERQHQDLMDVVQSPEAQEAHDISQVLGRRQFSDGGTILSELHYNKKLQKVPVSQVSLTPLPSHSMPLAEVNAEIRKLEGGYVPPKNDPSHLQEGAVLETDPTLNEQRIVEGETSTDNGTDPKAIAQNLMAQAELLKADAHALVQDADAKLAEAYKLDPTLKPKKARGKAKAKAKSAAR